MPLRMSEIPSMVGMLVLLSMAAFKSLTMSSLNGLRGKKLLRYRFNAVQQQALWGRGPVPAAGLLVVMLVLADHPAVGGFVHLHPRFAGGGHDKAGVCFVAQSAPSCSVLLANWVRIRSPIQRMTGTAMLLPIAL